MNTKKEFNAAPRETERLRSVLHLFMNNGIPIVHSFHIRSIWSMHLIYRFILQEFTKISNFDIKGELPFHTFFIIDGVAARWYEKRHTKCIQDKRKEGGNALNSRRIYKCNKHNSLWSRNTAFSGWCLLWTMILNTFFSSRNLKFESSKQLSLKDDDCLGIVVTRTHHKQVAGVFIGINLLILKKNEDNSNNNKRETGWREVLKLFFVSNSRNRQKFFWSVFYPFGDTL